MRTKLPESHIFKCWVPISFNYRLHKRGANDDLNRIQGEYSKKLESIIKKRGYQDYKWIDPKKIVVSQWVRMKCMFGCGEYSNNASCPPNVPSVSDSEKFFHEYNMAVIFRLAKK